VSPARRVEQVCAALLAAVALALVGLGVEGRQLRWVLWSDRDLWRALETPWATTGPELSFGSGGRIPGGGVQLLLAPLVRIDGDPLFVWRCVAVGIGLGLVALGLLVRRPLGGLVAGVTMAGVMVSDVVPDALWTIWNPALLGPFALVAWGAWVRVVHDRDGRWLPVLTGALAFGAQLHASTAGLAVAMLVPVAVARPTLSRRTLALALGVPLLLYAPYLADEALHGWRNTRLLLGQGASMPPPPPGLFGRNLAAALIGLAGPNPHPATPTFLERGGAALAVTVARWGLVAVGIVAALRPGADPARRRTTLGAAAVVAIVALAVASTSFDLSSATTRRFFVGVLPGAALLGGLGAAALVGALGGRRPTAGALAALAVTAMLGTQAAATEERWRIGSGSWGTWSNVSDLLATVRARTGWSLEQTAARTVLVAGGGGGGWGTDWFPTDGIAYLLAREHAEFLGSQRSLCAVAFPFVPPTAPPLDAALLGRVLRVDPATVHLREVARTEAGHVVATYHLGHDPCPTSLVDRYVPTEAEQAAAPIAEQLADGEVVEIPGPGGARRFVARTTSSYGDGGERPLVWVVDLVTRPGHVDVVVDADQLRGHSYNGGMLANVLVAAPRLEFGSPHLVDGRLGGVPPLLLADGLVGHVAAVPPLRAGLDLPSGVYPVALRWEDVALPERRPAAVPEAPRRKTRSLKLVDDLVVP
jgi:hypothetical protein